MLKTVQNRIYILAGIILLVGAVTACQEKYTETTIPEKSHETLASVLPSFVYGTWVLADYQEDVIKTKSPARSSTKLWGLVNLVLDSNTIEGDSLVVGASLNNHEGDSFTLYTASGQTSGSFATSIVDYDSPVQGNFVELGYEIHSNDTSLFLYRYNAEGKLLDKKRFIKVQGLQVGDDLGEGIQYVVNKYLIAGTYKMRDTSKEIGYVYFDIHGNIADFPGFTTYYVTTDFVAEGDENSEDTMCFDGRTSNQRCYVFDIKGDTLTLYDAIEDEQQVTRGAVQYILVRQ